MSRLADSQSPAMDGIQATADDADEDDAHDSPSAHSARPFALSRSACEACRARKIRCDKESPCLPCRRANIQCVHPAAKRREKRTRILLTPQYESKIDSIEQRLGDITRLLQNLQTHASGPADKGEAEEAQSSCSPSLEQSLPPESTSTTFVEGHSSLSAQSVLVNNFLQTFVEAQPLDPEIQRTLDTLSHIVCASDEDFGARDSALPNAQLPRPLPKKKFKLPPIENAVTLIRAAQAQRLAGTGWVYEFITIQSFGDLCLKVYFPEQLSPFDFISVNAGLYSLFWDYASTVKMSQDDKERNMAYARLCRDNLETGLAELPLHLPASADVVVALLFGAFYSIEFSTSSLSWSLSAKASELCQTLGYHRKPPPNGRQLVSPKYAQFLFWTAYYVDKSLSLRLGRASTIQDSEITTSPPSMPNDDEEPVLAFLVLWTKTARCQGNIYEMLYSPASLSQPDTVRQSRVDLLASCLHEIEQETEKTRAQWLKLAKERSGHCLMDFYAFSDDVLRLSLLTHVYRAAPCHVNSATTFNVNCVETARATLDRHHDCIAVIHQTGGIYFPTYINWTLLFAPFVPFIVLFCHVMETRDRTDLARLDAFVSSIQAATEVSKPAAKMHRLFQTLEKIAARYVEVGMHQSTGGPSSAPAAMDAQLAGLGFPRAGGIGAAHDGMGPEIPPVSPYSLDPVLCMGDNMQLEDWFYNNQASMELLQGTDVHSTWTG